MNYATLHDDAFAYDEYLCEDELYQEYVDSVEYELWIAQAQQQQDENEEFWSEEEPTFFLEEGWNDSTQVEPTYEHIDARISRSAITSLTLKSVLERVACCQDTSFFFYAHEADNILLWHKPVAMLFALQHNVYVRQLVVVEENNDWVEKEVFTSFYDYVNR